MPCYDPTPSQELEMYPNWLCQAFKMLITEQILSIKGIMKGYYTETAYQWWLRHLKEDKE